MTADYTAGVLPIAVMAGPGAERAAELLREQGGELVEVAVTGRPGGAGLVVGVGAGDEDVVDAVVRPSADAVARLWADRVGPFARRLAGLDGAGSAPAVLLPHDPALLTAARRLLRRIGDGLAGEGLDDGSWTYDHIGSTAVSGIRAKRFVDLQLGVDPLPEAGSAFDRVLLNAGYQPATGARPDSPGGYRDGEREPGLAPAAAYRKRLYFRPDPELPSILHVRPLGGPWWSYTVLFRDWLRVDPDARNAYAAAKLAAAAAHAGDADHDDYTRAKTAFFDRAHPEFERLGRTSPYRVRR